MDVGLPARRARDRCQGLQPLESRQFAHRPEGGRTPRHSRTDWLASNSPDLSNANDSAVPPPDLNLLTRDQITQQVDRFISSPEHRTAARSTLLYQLKLRARYGKSPVSLKAGLLDARGSRLDRATPMILFFSFLFLFNMANSSGTACAFFCALGLAAVLTLAIAGIARTQRFRSDSARTRRGLCAACAFDLSAHSEPIPPPQLANHRLGPPRCPECGLIWPLLARLRHE